MARGYNALRYVKVNHLEAGICPEHGYLLTSEQCNCYPKETALMFAAEQTKGEDWEQKADALRNILDNEGLAESYKRFREANKPNEDAVDVGI